MQFSEPSFALFEDNLGETPHAILLEDLELHLCVQTPAELPEALQQIDAAQSRGCWLSLAASYALGAALEPAVPARNTDSSEPLLQVWVFRRRHELAGEALAAWWQARLAPLNPQATEAGMLNLEPDWLPSRHAAATRRILDYIHAGDCYQVNLTFPLRGQAFGHPLALAARLREAQPVAHGALICHEDNWIISRSPELFVARTADQLSCRPMKGTALRSADAAQDLAAATQLQASEKDRAENLMIVDLIRNDLGRLAPPGGVKVEGLFELEAYRTVYQLTSSISAQPVRSTLSEILHALFPCGSVTGAPKIRAMQIIQELEDSPRGLYCGALGWLAPEGDFSLNVPIRTVLLDTQRRVRLNVGSGIVADSEAAAEYQECLAKAGFLLGLSKDLQLIETLRWEPEFGYPHLSGHLQRLCRSAKTLHISCQPDAIEDALRAFAGSLPAVAQRVRLLLGRTGQIQLQAFALEANPEQAEFSLADWLIDAADPRLQHKTTARNFYDSALKNAMARGLFDLVFCNTRGELCEGARSNLFLEINGQLLTPAAHCGLLPGVLRAELLAKGLAHEAVLYPHDLARAQRIWLGNALRGLIEVSLKG